MLAAFITIQVVNELVAIRRHDCQTRHIRRVSKQHAFLRARDRAQLYVHIVWKSHRGRQSIAST